MRIFPRQAAAERSGIVPQFRGRERADSGTNGGLAHVTSGATGIPVGHGPASQLGPTLDAWLSAHAEGIACVIGDPTFRATPRVRSLTPELAKGLEFDLVVLIDPEKFGTGIEGAVDRYVAMTRATQQLVILTSS